tara:strand:- start:789 stop:2024 length:1236 start_codon:yes stop_codon:yes gene_type:complete
MLNNKTFYIQNLNIFLISILPLGLIVGTLISNTIIFLICIFFIYDLSIKNNFFYLNQKNFYFLIIIYIYLILNSYFISENQESLIKSFGFVRFIILAYAVSYYYREFGNRILKIWTLFFIIVSLDILFEYVFGKNILGFQSQYPARITSFSGDEMKIGGYYFGFILLSLFYLKKYKQNFFLLLLIIFFIISLLIGERSNFIKIFIMYFLFFTFFYNISYLKKFFSIILLFAISVLIIINIPGLKSKFYNHIVDQELRENIKLKKESIDYNKLISNNRHLSHYYVATEIFKENILFGSGFKSFRIESPKKKYQKNGIYGASTHPHQFHFEILSELGLVGYILIFSNLIYILFKKFNYNKDLIRTGALLFILASLIPILPSGSFFTSYGATIFFINYSFLIQTKDYDKIKSKN